MQGGLDAGGERLVLLRARPDSAGGKEGKTQ
jgi:hypothetical protein